MRHDGLCERDSPVATIYSTGCKCASRAYKRDPLLNDWTPIWAKAKTPDQEGG